MKLLRAIIVLSILTSSLHGQIGREFWFAVPDITEGTRTGFDSDNGIPHHINITALYATTVRISKPADLSFTPIEFNLGDMDKQQIILTNLLNISYIETVPSNNLTSPTINGFLIESEPGEISAYYEWENDDNKEIMPLKGKNALGKDFWVSTQNFYKNDSLLNVKPLSGFVILATKDNTSVEVYRNMDFKYFFSPPASETLHLTLNKGETFAFTQNGLNNPPINGIRVTSSEDIVITSYADALIKNNYSGVDMAADQIVPVDNIGYEYFVKRGMLSDQEFLMITGTVNATNFTYNGAVHTLNAGEFERIELLTDTAYIDSDQPIYVNHITGLRDELAYAQLPSIDNCVGSNLVPFVRDHNNFSVFHPRIIARNDPLDLTASNFSIINGIDTFNIPNGYFEYTSDSNFIYLKDGTEIQAFMSSAVPSAQQVKFYNSVSRFQLGVLGGNKINGSKYGFFSDYSNTAPSAGIGGFTFDRDIATCNLNPIRLAASGGEDYAWTGVSDAGIVDFLSNDSIADPIFSPDSAGEYIFNVKISGSCGTDTIVIISNNYPLPATDFLIAPSSICSPDSILIENISDTTDSAKQLWTFEFDGLTDTIDQATIPTNPFYYVFPNNNLSDTIQIYTVTLHSFSPGDHCEKNREKYVSVKPQVDVSFTASSNIGCAPLTIDFEETINTAYHDTSMLFRWDFGNGAQATDTTPEVTFNNIADTTRIYNVELVAETPLGCLDTFNLPITIYPTVEAAFGIDTNLSCSPLVATLNPGASINAETLTWHIYYSGTDSTHVTNTTLPITINHYDTTINTGPDTLGVYLVVENTEGCKDSTSISKLYVYPNITADFDVDKNEICDGDSIKFTNESFGYKPRFEWDFGNSSYAQDSIDTSQYTKTYFNRSDIDTLYTVRLKAISGNICSAIKDTIITVHPYVKADFSFEYDNNCSPLNSTISNTCIGVDSLYFWELGDGSTSNSDLPSFDHLYSNPYTDRDTTYRIKLTVTSSKLCRDTTERWLTLLPEVVADFEILDTSICSHNEITFNNNSTGNNLTFLWKYGDNQSSTRSDSVFTKYYENNDSVDVDYNISLIAKNAIGCADTAYETVEVLANISAFFSLPKADSCSPFRIRPLSLSSESANEFRWDFGPEGSSNLEIPAFPIFTNNIGVDVDSFIVELAVAGADDPQHWACSDTHRIPILIYPELRAEFDLDTSILCQPLITGFTNNTSPTDETVYAWYRNSNFFSNKFIPDDIKIANNTNTDSTHTIWLYGTSRYGCRDTASHSAEVYALVDAGFTIDRIGMCDYDSVYIDRTSSRGDISNVEWRFNGSIEPYTVDDTLFYHSFASHTDTLPQERKIFLTIENSKGCSDSAKQSMLLYPTVTADFDVDSKAACYEHTTSFTNTSDNADYWFWSYGDGLSSTEEEEPHFYSNHSNTLDSVYNISMIARSKYDCYDTHYDTVTVWPKPKADFYFPVTIACPPFIVQMENNSNGSNLSYSWSYADTTSTGDTTSFEFNNYESKIEEQRISLTVTSDKGCIDSLQKSIRVYPNLDVNITTDNDTNGCSPLDVSFGIEDIDTKPQMIWYIDGTAFSTIEDPSHRFTNPDPGNNTHTIKLIAHSINNCVDSDSIQITVYPTPDIIFNASPIPADYDYTTDQTIINFNNSTKNQDVWEYEWDFGDGSTNQLNQNSSTFSHTYGDHFWGDKNDDFRVPITLTAWNPDNPICSDTDSIKIIINPPVPQVDIREDVSGCQPLTVEFSADTSYIYEDSYEWEFGDKIVTSNDPSPSFTYTEAGQYHVTLTVEGDYGKMSDYKIIRVFPKPTIDFAFNDTVVSINIDTVNFYNHSLYAIENYWYFDSENIFSGNYDSEEVNPNWTFSEPGELGPDGKPIPYYPALIAKSAEECYDTLISPIGIRVYEIGLIKFPNTFLVVPGQPSEEYATDQAINGGNRYLFYPKHESVERYHIEIYNRWGSKIFESFDVNRGWNGLIEGNLGKQDVYVYRVRGRYTNGQSFDISGDVTLVYSKPVGEQ